MELKEANLTHLYKMYCEWRKGKDATVLSSWAEGTEVKHVTCPFSNPLGCLGSLRGVREQKQLCKSYLVTHPLIVRALWWVTGAGCWNVLPICKQDNVDYSEASGHLEKSEKNLIRTYFLKQKLYSYAFGDITFWPLFTHGCTYMQSKYIMCEVMTLHSNSDLVNTYQ